MMILWYILAAMWSIGMLSLVITFTYSVWDDVSENIFGILATIGIGVPTALFLVFVPWALIHDAESPNLATLKKANWVCNSSHQEIIPGKTPMMKTVCDNYFRIS